MTWLYWLTTAAASITGLWMLFMLSCLDERKAHRATAAALKKERSAHEFTNEVLSDVVADRNHLQDVVLSLQARLRAREMLAQSWRGGLN